MNVSIFSKMTYEYKRDWTIGQSKPNSNPIQTQTKPISSKAKMNVNSLITKDYRKKDDFAVQKNKPNTNPIFLRTKTNATLFTTKDYENETSLRPQKNKPKQTQSPHPLSSAFCYLSSAFCPLSSALRWPGVSSFDNLPSFWV